MAPIAGIGLIALVGLQAGQQPSPRPGWPCVGRPDPSYVKVAEGSGGQLFLLDPSELGESSVVLMMAPREHPATLRRVVGEIAGDASYSIPVDGSINRLLFTVSVQCLQTVEIARPSGALVAANDPDVEWHAFQAGRLVIVRTPDTGNWRIALAGKGLAVVVVQAKAAVNLELVRFVTEDGPADGLIRDDRPLVAGTTRLIELRVSPEFVGPQFELRSSTDEIVGSLLPARRRDSTDQTFLREFVVPSVPFRVVATGQDAAGRTVQRSNAPLVQVSAPREQR
jgi:von Willebrand factor A domain-containing protein 7